MYECKINLDSISPKGFRLTTFIVTYPRLILSQVNTHRMLSKNSSSSRAIPTEKKLKQIKENPFIPEYWGKNQKGMQAEEDLSDVSVPWKFDFDDTRTMSDRDVARMFWLNGRDAAYKCASDLSFTVKVHKQIANRVIEPYMWHTSIISGTNFSNFFNLRVGDAQPEIRKITLMMRDQYENSKPTEVNYGQWHAPLLNIEDPDEAFGIALKYDNFAPCKVSVGRCARVSYLTHDGKRNIEADLGLHDRMLNEGHMSPFEHVARPMTERELVLFSQKKLRWDEDEKDWMWVGFRPDLNEGGEYTHFLGNFNGWVQYRKQIPGEWDILAK